MTTANPIFDEISRLSPEAQAALLHAHTAMAGGATPAAPPPIAPIKPPQQPVPALGAAPAASASPTPQTPQMPIPAAGGAVEPPKAADVAPMGPMPPLGGAPSPLPLDENKLNHIKESGSGISQIHSKIENAMPNHPMLGKALGWGAQIPLQLADTALAMRYPNIESRIPGTQGHHNIALGQANRQVGLDEGRAREEAGTAATNAEAQLRNAQEEALNTIPLTPEEAQAAGNPDLEGVAVTAAQKASLLKQAGINTTKENVADTNAQAHAGTAHDPFHEWMANPSDYEKFVKAMTAAKAKPETPGKNTGFMTMFAAYRMLHEAYTHNPALLPVVAPMLDNLFKQQGVNLPVNAEQILSGVPQGQPENAQGVPIGLSQPESPTGATRSRGQFAESILPAMADAETKIGQLRDKLGPFSGRFNDLYTSKIGAYGPEFSGLQQTLHNIATAWMRLHANSESSRQDFLTSLASAKDPDNLIANLKSIDKQAADYVKQGKGRGGQGAGQGGAQTFTDNGVTYQIPADKVDAFKKDHPNAK